ncbi:MAG: hypothetical protein WCA11_13960 [Terracidiphilus sp.]
MATLPNLNLDTGIPANIDAEMTIPGAILPHNPLAAQILEIVSAAFEKDKAM